CQRRSQCQCDAATAWPGLRAIHPDQHCQHAAVPPREENTGHGQAAPGRSVTRPISPYVKALALAGGVMVPALSQAQDMQGMPGMTMPSKPSSSAKPSTTPSQKTAPDIQAMPGMTMPANPQGGTTL